MDIYTYLKCNLKLLINIKYRVTDKLLKDISLHFKYSIDKIYKSFKLYKSLFKFKKYKNINKIHNNDIYIKLLYINLNDYKIESILNIQIIIFNEYINASDICLQMNVKLNKWLHLLKTKHYLKHIEYMQIFYKNNNLILYKKDGYAGIYIHKHLLADLLRWISPKFHIKSQLILEKYINDKYIINIDNQTVPCLSN